MFWVNPPRCSQRDFHGSPHASKIPANLTACGTPGAAGNVTQTHDLLDTSLRMFVPVNLCGWMGYVAHPTPDSRELCNSCPAWGVTFRPCLAGLHQAISIHAPAWGATRYPCSSRKASQMISIHAPAWGATRELWRLQRGDELFQFTPPRGGRHGSSG